MSERSHDRAWPLRLTGEHWSVLLIAFVAFTAPAFGQDDAAFFNYFNNVSNARPVFYYLEYVPLAPELVAYALRGLPLVFQAVLYRVLPFIVMLVLYRELRGLVRVDRGGTAAGLFAIVAVLLLRVVEANIWANLVFVITPMFLAAALHILRINREGRQYSAWAMAAIVLAAVSVPFGILLVPILLAHVPGDQDRRRRLQHVVLGGLLTAAYAFFNAHALRTAVSLSDPMTIAVTFLHGFRSEYRFNNIVATVSLLVLAMAVVEAWWRGRSRVEIVTTVCLAWLGAASVGGVIVSDRLLRGDGGLGAAHVLPALVAALVVTCRFILDVRDRERRALLVGVFAGALGVAVVAEMGGQLRGPLETALMRYRFLMVAEGFRQHCRDGDGMVYEYEDSSPVVLCRPRAFSPGRHLQSSFPPTVGSRDPEALEDEQPLILVGQPLF